MSTLPMSPKTLKILRPSPLATFPTPPPQEHSARENVSVQSPGPAAYQPENSPTKERPSAYSLGLKAASYFDVFLDPARQTSPGPVYNASPVTGKGARTWGNDPRATFGSAHKSWDPELNLSRATFISTEHAMHANQSVHSPGPVYFPTDVKRRVPAPALSSGQFDRFYDRFELGRIL